MKFSTLRGDDEVLPDFRLRSMQSPEKKDSTISAMADGAIVGFSASIFREKLRQPLFIAALHFVAVYLLHRSPQITPQTTRG